MSTMIYCTYLKREAPALERAPLPGEAGQKILKTISAEAWAAWVRHQTMLINENRLSLIEPAARAFLAEEMNKFLFGSGSEQPAGYTPPDAGR